MKTMLARLGFRLLKMADASLQWDTSDVPGLFAKKHTGRMVYTFRDMRFRAVPEGISTLDHDGEWNFTHTCPGDPECL